MVRCVAIIIIVVLAIGILGTCASVGSSMYQYMSRQNFTINRAFEWAWNDFVSALQETFGKDENYNLGYFDRITAEDMHYLMKH